MLGRRLVGFEAIREELGWKTRKLERHMDELKQAGAVSVELEGCPPRRRLVSYQGLLERYIISRNQALYEEKKKGADPGPR